MTTTNFTDGLSNVYEYTTLGTFVQTDPSKCHTWFDDFDNYAANEWVVTKTGAGGTVGVANADGGILAITNDTADNDHQFLQWSGETASGAVETWKFATKKQFWFKARFKVSDATNSDLVLGLQITDTSPLSVSDGVYFIKADDAATLEFKTTLNSTSTTSTVGTLTDDTYVVVGFHYDGNDKVDVYLNENRVATQGITNLVTDEELTLSFGIQNGAGAAKTLSVDYILVSKER